MELSYIDNFTVIIIWFVMFITLTIVFIYWLADAFSFFINKIFELKFNKKDKKL